MNGSGHADDVGSLPVGVLATPPSDAWQLDRGEPSPALRPYVVWLWSVEWDLTAYGDHQQSTLPHPSAHLVVENGAVTIHGPTRSRFSRTLTGAGRVVAVRFEPAGLRPFLREPMTNLVDRQRSAHELLPELQSDLAEAVDRCASRSDAMAVLDDAVAQLRVEPGHHEAVRRTNVVVDLIAGDRSLTTVTDVATATGRHPRSLQRDFAEYVGLGPKVVLRRSRLQEAAAAALAGSPVEWAATAARLGYYDQAHLVRDFTEAIGMSPAAYSRGHSSAEH